MADSSIFSDSDPTRRLFGDNRLFPERTPVFGWDATAPGMNDPRPDPAAQMRAARVSTALIDGTVLSSDELAADKYGARLMAIRSRTSKFGFKDALFHGSFWDFVPFMGMLATAAGDLSAARDASNAFQKMLRGEQVTRDEAIRATLWKEEQEMRAEGTWGAMFGSIVRQAPAFAAEMGVLNLIGGAARTAAARGALGAADSAARAGNLTDDLVDSVLRLNVTRGVKRASMFEYGPMFVRDAIAAEQQAGGHATAAAAARVLRDDPVAVAKLTEQVANGVTSVLQKSSPELTRYGSWAPLLQERVASRLAERAVRADLAYMSRDSRWARWFDATRRAMADSFVEGLVDLGAWGSESATTLTTTHSRASRAFAQAALDFTVYPTARGAALFAPREAVSFAGGKLVSAATGRDPVRENTLSMQYEAWKQNNPDLMDSAETYGLVLDLLEYVSENSGRGFSNFMRGVGLSVAPNLIRPARKVAGLVEKTGATQIVRDTAGKITDIVAPVGLVDAASSAEVGGVLSRYVGKVFGGRSLREGLAQRRFNAVVGRLEKAGVRVNDRAALQATIESGVMDRALDPQIARVIGSDVKGFVDSALKESDAVRLFGMKTHALFMYHAMDFMARHNFDAQRAYEAFKSLGYDGITSEMFEERYIDVVKELFGIDAQQKGFHERLATAIQRLVWPEGGLKQLMAEAAGFAVPAVARAGVARTIAAMSSQNDYAKHNMWSATIGDLVKYGSIGTYHKGDYIAKTDEQIQRLREAARTQREQASAGEVDGVPLTETRRADLVASAERYEEGALRAERLRRSFMASLGDADGDAFDAPIYTDSQLVAGDFEFERHMQLTADQARHAMASYRELIAFSPNMGQLQYKARHKTPEESAGWFRKAAHWATEHAVRAAGFAATGDLAFLTANPAAFAAEDKGVDRHLLDLLHDGYAQDYDAAVRRLREGSADGTVNTDSAHEMALESFRPKAEGLVAGYLASMQALAFSHGELADIALAKVAEDDGFIVDAKGRRLVRRVPVDAARPQELEGIGYDEFLARPGVQARVDAEVDGLARVTYDALTSAASERASASVLAGALDRASEAMMLRAIARIPAGLPTAQQALMAAVLKYSPAFAGSGDARMRNIMVEKQVDPSRPLADQLTGISNYKDVLDTVASLAFGDRRLETQDDIEAAISEGVGRVDPGVMETIGRVLGYEHDFTEKGIQERDAKILRYALQTTAFDDPDRAVYSRPAPVAEDDKRFGSVDDETVTVVHSGGKWSGQFLRVSTNARVPVSANTLEELDRMLADDDFGYARRRRRIIHTPVRVLYGDSALDFIRALNLGREYRERQEAVYQQTGDQTLLDPLLRKHTDGSWMYTPEEAEEIRRQEAARAADFAAHGRQGPGLASGTSPVDVTHWLRQGESAEDDAAVLRARQRMTEARQAWLNRERRQEQDGRALGYNAIAEELVSGYGVRGASNSAFENKFAVADAGARGRFSMALSAYSRRLGGDIYVSIDHGTAQSYSASLLRGAVNEALARSFNYVNRMFGPYVKGFLVEAEKVIDKRIADAKDDLERAQWQEFRSATVGGVGNGSRKASLATISSFIEAFCLYRTEVPERELYSTLGDFYAQLKAIAPDMRKSGAYLPFCAMADYVLGGRGFSMLGLEPDADPLANGRRGLAFFYKLFAPATSSLRAAISDTLPAGQSEDQKQQAVRDFVDSLQEKAQAAFRPRVSTPGSKRTSSRGTAGPAPSPSPAPTPAPAPASAPASAPTASVAAETIVKPLDVAPTVAVPSVVVPSVVEEVTKSLLSGFDGLATMDAAQAVLDAEARKNGRPPTEEEAAVFAASLAGDTAEAYPGAAENPVEQPEGVVPEEEESLPAVSEDGEQYADTDDEEDSVDGGRYDDAPRGFASVEPESPSRVLDDNGEPVPRPEASNLPGLAEDEAKVFSSVVARVLSFSGADVDVGLVRAFLRRVAPAMSQAEIDQVAAAYEATGGRFVGDTDWVFDVQKDEEGITPDGYDFNDTHNVEVIKSDLMRRMLAILSRVSPATGRDFQPFVEDLRSFADGVERVLVPAGVADAKVEEASRWLWKLLNPRANGNFDSAVGRDAAYSELLDMMDPPPRGSQTLPAKWMQAQSYVQAFIGKAGTPAPCARAALFVSYLMGLPSNVREQLTRFISSSAPAQPVETSTHYDAKGNVYFITHAARFRPGSASREAMASALAIFADRPPAELLAAADGLEKAFRDEAAKAKAEHRLAQLVGAFKKGADRVVSLPDGSGLFDVYARLLAPVLGGDNPLVVAFMSRRFANLVRSTRPDRRLSSSALANLAKFAYRGDDGDLPFAVQDLVSLMRVAAKASKGPRVDRQTLLDATRGTFQSSAPAARALHFAPSSVMGRGPWASLITEYSRAKPVSVMRAKNDETRTRQPASSLAITMPGVEPVLQQFLDRKDDRGAEAFCREFFPEAVKGPDFDMGLLRQRMEWPDGTGIVAHQIVKTAYANEVREGNKFTYENKDSDMLYVAAFAGDHTSGFIFQAPVAKQLRDRGITYEQAEKWVADLLGVDLFGVDAKRSMLSSLEAPGFSLVGLKHDSSGEVVVDAEGRPQLGRLRYGILWHPEGGADANEALKGSLGMYGYGARRARKMARDPSLAVCKLHVASVGTEPNGITMPEITKSLVTAHFQGTAERYGQFVDGPMRTVMEYAEKLAGNDPADTAIVTDADSPKMSLVNSKMLGVVVAGKQLAIKDFVLDVALKGYLDSGKELAKGASISGAELDAVLSAATGQVPGEGREGLVPVKNLAKGGEVSWVRLSEFVPGLAVTCVQDGIYALEYDAANLMGFQVANVAHKAKASAKSVARNHLMDMGSVGRVLETHNADADSGLNILPGLDTTTSLVGDVVANYGFLATAITTDEKSIGLTLERNEDWQRLRRLNLPTTGPQADEIRRQAYSTWVNSIRTPAMRKIPAALVSSGAWIDRVTGEVKCTGASQMYLDMQQGERTIGRADRAFWRAHKRVALAGVNSTDVSFRHGLFVDEKGLLSDPELAWAVPAEGTDAQRVVVALENIIGGIVSGCSGWSATDGQAATPEGDAELERYYRHKLGQYLKDHTGKALSERTFESKDKKTGETVLRSYSQTVKYLDLFTRMTADAEGNFAFDRSAVYEGIHDQNGEVHLYLGGTKFAFTRTPSYNLHVEVVRAGLPATTVPTEDGGWMCGTDAIVMADPFSLKMLGNDNDGDKADLYMLDQGDGHMMQGDDEGLFCYDKGNIDGIFRRDLLGRAEEALVKYGDPESARRCLVEWRRWLVSEGILVRERVKSSEPGGRPVEGKLVLSPLAKRRLSNTLVLGWFDMNSAIPVPSDAANVPRYTGTVSDGTRRGSMSVGVKASTSVPMYKEGEPDDKYPEHTRIRENSVDYVLDAAAPKLLDLKDPAKRIDNGATAAAVETSAHLVADCRARFVATARNLNVLWAARAPEGLALLFKDARDFVDSVLHLDGPSNMSFDDMKEQVCSRLGLWPGMADTFIAEYFVLNGELPVTDALANKAMRSYAEKVNRRGSLYNYMLRASNPSDFQYRRERLRDGRTLEGLYALFQQAAEIRGLAKPKLRDAAADRWIERLTRWMEYSELVKPPSDAVVGAYDCLRFCEESDMLDVAVEFSKWADATSAIARGSQLARAINYSYADPGDPGAYSTYRTNMTDVRSMQAHDGFDSAPAKDAPALIEPGTPMAAMFTATQLLLRGDGRFSAYNRGLESADTFKGTFAAALQEVPPVRGGSPSAEGMFLAAASVASRVAPKRTITLANNARTVGRAAATFLAVPSVKGSVFNDSADGRLQTYRKCAMLAEAVAFARHAPKQRRGEVRTTTNVTADFLWAVETMVDVLSRFVSLSHAHRVAPIADLLREEPAGSGYGFDEADYGPAVEGAARISLALPDMSDEQLKDLQGMMRRLVDERVLDRDGVEGSKAFRPTNKGMPLAGGDVFYEFSAENMRRMLKTSEAQTGTFAQKKVSKEGAAAGTQRDLQEGLRILIGVFEYLSKEHPEDFPAGFSVQPSALFGQLLPIYAALTDVPLGVPGPGTRALSSSLLDYMAPAEFLVGQMNGSPAASRYLRLAEALDYGLVPGYSQKEDFKLLRAVPTRSELAQRTRKAVLGGLPKDGLGSVVSGVAKPAGLSGFYPRAVEAQPRPTLGVFDGPRGVAFEALVNIMASYRDNPYAGLDESELAPAPTTAEVPVERPEEQDTSLAGRLRRQQAEAFDIGLSLRNQFADLPVAGGGRRNTSAAPASVSAPVPAQPSVKWQLTPVRANTARATKKDQDKFNKLGGITKFIGFGAKGTSTQHYADTTFREIANTGSYAASDIVGVSVNGDTKNRVPLKDPRVEAELLKAVEAGATIIGDEKSYREASSYNVGEEELASWLAGHGYVEDAGSGVWRPGGVSPETDVSPDTVKEVGRRVAQVFKLWSGARAQYNPNDNTVEIFSDLVVNEGDPNARALKTCVKVHVTNGGLNLGNREAVLRSVAARSGVSYEKLSSDPALAEEMIKKYPVVAGVTTFRFDDAPGAFRVAAPDLEMLVADVSLDARKVALHHGTEFHEAFHAALGFARAVGVLTDADIDVLAKKYGGMTYAGQKWFDEEQAAPEYQALLNGKFRGLSATERTSEGIFQKFFEFIKMLVDALRNIVADHRSEDYANPIASNPLTGLVLTGRIAASKGEGKPTPKTMDRQTRLYEALRNEFVQEGGVMQGAAEDSLQLDAGYFDAVLELMNAVKRLVGVDRFPDDASAWTALRAHGQAAYREKADWYGAYIPDLDNFIGGSLDESPLLKDVHRAVDLLRKYGPVVSRAPVADGAALVSSADLEPGSPRRLQLKEELNHTLPEESVTGFPDPADSVKVLESARTILSNEELAYWNDQGMGSMPRILVASEHTDPVLFSRSIIDLVEGRTTLKRKDGTDTGLKGHDFAGLYIITKHDGLPIKRILETKIPKLIHFSITSLGGTPWEPHVMRYQDLLTRIGEYIEQGLDPRSVTIRIDPIVPGVTKPKDVREIMQRAKAMGITRVRFSVMDGYSNVLPHFKRLGYDPGAHGYTIVGTDQRGRIERHATPETIRGIMQRMKAIADEVGVTLGTCAEPYGVEGISKEACLSVDAVNEMLGTDLPQSMIGRQRKECHCYGGKVDGLAWSKACPSDCAYCYAHHQGDFAGKKNPLGYYEDGRLVDNDFTRTRPDVMATVGAVPVQGNPESSGSDMFPGNRVEKEPVRLSDMVDRIEGDASAGGPGLSFSFADRFASLPVISADDAARGGFASVEPADPVLPKVRDALARAGIPMQMATPYGGADAMAALVGAILRNDATPEQREVAERIAERAARARGADHAPGAMVHAAIERVRWLYGTHPDDRSVAIAGSILQALADGKYSTNGTSLTVGGNPERTRRSHATRASLAAAVAVTSGTMPSDILEAALFDLRAIRDRRGSGNTLSDEVLGKHFIPELERLYAIAADPTGLLEMFDPGREEGPSRSDPHSVFARLEAGLTEQRDLQGNRVKFKVAAAGSSDNPFHLGNVDLYHDHEDDPDFQRAAGIALDAVYMVAAARRMYMDLGFRPGTPDQELYAPGVLSPAEMAADLAAAPEQYEDPSFSAVDSGWFVAASQDDWLDSVMRPAFGSVKLRDAAQNSHRAVARFRWRATSLNNLHAYEYGLSGNPGDALLAVDEEYRGDRFGWSAGAIAGDRVREFSDKSRYEPGDRVRHDGKLWRAKRALDPAAWDASAFDKVYEDPVRRYDHLNRTPAKDRDGNKIRMTRTDMRVVDLVLKARLAWMSGARKLVTGVDGLTFHYEMPDDVSEYTREKVKARIDRGAAGGETDLDKALNRLDIQLRDSYGAEQFDWITESGAGRYGLRQSLVEAACAALKRAKRLVDAKQMSRARVNDYVISALSQAGLVSGVQKYSKEFGGPVYMSAAVSLDPDRIEELFLQSATYRKLLDAGRRAEWLTRDAYLRPYVDLVREMRQFTLANPFIGRGAARFFQGVTSPMPFSGGDGITVYGLARAAEDDPAEVAQEVRTSFADAFERNIGNADELLKAPADVVLMVRQLFHLPAGDVETVRRRLAQGDFSGVRGLEDIGAGSTVGDLVGAVQRRLDDLVFNKSFGSRDAALFGGRGVVKSLVRAYREASYDANAPVPNVAGLAPDAVHRMTGRLPANFQAGHAVVNMADGLANALAYRATLVNMVTTPDADGMPLCYAKPALDAEATTGVPDAVWGEVARWWGEIHGLAYDGLKTGVENARAMYDEIVEGGRIDKDRFGSINPEDMDDRAVEGFWARKGVPEGESELSHLAGGYALGYAKHLFRSTKGLGTKWQRAMVHRAWAYSKAMSVSFSLFFPLATRFESPVGAVGMMATLGGNISPEFVRRHAKALNGILGALGSPAWITRGFTGEADFAKMLDSNDPFLAEMYDFASAIGLTMSTADANPEENARGILQGDLKNLVAFVRAKFGDSAAKKVADISGALLTHASEKAFTYHLNATKLAVAAQLCMKLRADAAKEGIAFDPVRDMRRYASYVNAEIGGIDPLQYAWAHPGMQNFLNSLFFSWQWTRGAWEAGGGKVIEQVLFGGHDVTPEERRFIIGRAIRMYGWIAFGIPTVAQFMIKAIAMAIDPDHEDRDEEKWWIWDNEDKANMKAFNLTPLMRAIAKRFPRYAEWRGEHRTLAALPTAAFMLTKSPWLSLAALPVYTGTDPRNTTGLRPYYMHFGKQVWEFNRWFESPWQQFASKLAMPVQRLTEGVLGRSLTWMDHPLPWYRKGDVERWIAPTWDSAIVNLGKAFLPFSFAGLSDLGDAGLLPTLGPVSMGTSGQETLKELKADLEAWVTNDRAWYRQPRAVKRATSTAQAMRRFRAKTGENPVVWRHVANLLANGYSEMQARSMVDRAIGDLRSERYRKLEAMLPKRPDGDYDVKEWSRTVRELQKLGLTAKGAYDALLGRLRSSTAWKERASAELREKYFEMVKQAATPPQGERTY